MPPNHFRSAWVSDVHLGFKDCKAEFLLDFLRHLDCERLYLVGDFIDFWSLHKGGRWPSGHGRVLRQVYATCHSSPIASDWCQGPANPDAQVARTSCKHLRFCWRSRLTVALWVCTRPALARNRAKFSGLR